MASGRGATARTVAEINILPMQSISLSLGKFGEYRNYIKRYFICG
jgi:hypothetical protein